MSSPNGTISSATSAAEPKDVTDTVLVEATNEGSRSNQTIGGDTEDSTAVGPVADPHQAEIDRNIAQAAQARAATTQSRVAIVLGVVTALALAVGWWLDHAGRIAGLNSEVEAGRREKAVLEASIRSLNEIDVTLRGTTATLHEQINDARRRIDELKDDKKAAEDAARAARSENHQLEEANRVLTAANRSLVEDKKTLTDQHITLTSEKETLVRETQQLTKEKTELVAAHAGLQSSNHALAGSISALQTKKSELEASVTDLSAKVGRWMTVVDLLTRRGAPGETREQRGTKVRQALAAAGVPGNEGMWTGILEILLTGPAQMRR